MYDLELSVTLQPIWHDEPPQVRVACDDARYDAILEHDQTFDIKIVGQGRTTLSIEFSNKTAADTVRDQRDKAVIIRAIRFFEISDPKFVWLGRYRPKYPEPWYTQQVDLGQVPAGELTNTDYLGWNGLWTLEFDLPIFTWIHQVQNLGWIYR